MLKRIILIALTMALLGAAQCHEVEGKNCETCGKPFAECPHWDGYQKTENSGGGGTNTATAQTAVRMEGNTIVCTVDGAEYRYRMVRVEGGTFTMGCTGEQGDDCYVKEKPAHSVSVSGFYMGQTEVTQALWKAVTGSNPSYWKGNNLPVENVSYEDCQKFIKKLNSLTGLAFRLPTEAEWEYAARSCSGSRCYNKYSGSNDIGEVAWYKDNSGDKTHPVAQKQANELELYDMSGNVYEWCSDWYEDYSNSPASNPKGPSSGSRRVIRGGSWRDIAKGCRVSYRYDYSPSGRSNFLGFRLALGMHPKTESNKGAGGTNTAGTRSAVRMDGNTIVCTVDDAEYRYRMVRVDGGTFSMGCTGEQGGDCESWEKPAHSVSVSGFYMGQTEVTQALWKAVMGSNPSNHKGNNLPVEKVSYEDCQEFIKKLNSLTGLAFRLPTEAEWEYAARGGSGGRGYKYSGGDDLGAVAWYYGNSGRQTHPVAQKQANELGLYDMTGNVKEWCSDWYEDYSNSPASNPKGPSSGSYRIDRGGGWYDNAGDCRVSSRYCSKPSGRSFTLGFRLALGGHPKAESNNGGDGTNTAGTRSAVRMEGNTIVCTVDGAEYRYRMVYVSGGTFTMGCTGEQGGDCLDSEKPAHSVTVGGFYMGQTEVTQALWKAVTGSNPSYWKGNNLPVEHVSYEDCQEFIKKLNSLTGLDFRLPTEAEWEYAARGGSGSRGYKYSGGDDIGAVAWYYGNSGGETHPVAQKQANELGLYDMAGNVWELCGDWSGVYSSSATSNPKGPSSGSYRVYRGGSWISYARHCRVSGRANLTPSDRYDDLGFRLAR